VKALLDTCTFIWLTSAPARIPKKLRAILQDETNVLCLSDVSVLEICFKWTSRKLHLPAPPRTWVEEQANFWGLERLRLTSNIMYRSSELPLIHSDPFDRLLVASAIETDCTIATPDSEVAKYPVAVVW